jgi:outer membrane receptor protein involved in Fe transport
MKYGFFIIMLFSLQCAGQATGQVTGQAAGQAAIRGNIRQTNGLPIGNANVLLLKEGDSSLVKGTISDQKGDYSFDQLSAGKYLILISCVTYDSLYLPSLSLTAMKNLHMDTVRLNTADRQLEAVTVNAKKPLYEQKTDRMVINVQSSITSAGSSALEILERSPGVDVDRQSNVITMNGKDGVVVMIDGKITHMTMAAVIQLLAGMNSGNIDKIELITSPPAGYDAEGNAGFINIVMKKDTADGTNGSYSAAVGDERGGIGEASINFNHREGKLNLYGDLSFSAWDDKFWWAFYHQADNDGTISTLNTQAPRTSSNTGANGRLGLDYELNKKTILGILVSGFRNANTDISHNTGMIAVNNQVDSTLQFNSHESHRTTNIIANINLDHSFTASQKIVGNVDYMHWTDNDPISYSDSYFDPKGDPLYSQQLRSSKYTPTDFWVFKVDYSNRFNQHINFDAGLKATLSQLTNNIEVDSLSQQTWMKEATFTSKSYFKEDYPAAYASLAIRPDDRTSITMGLRYEYTWSDLGSDTVGNVVDRHYGDFFPNLSVSYKINKNNSIDLLYSRRITRPGFTDISPWVLFIDPYTFWTGNTGLQPAFANNFEFHYSLRQYVLRLSYSDEKNAFARYFPTIDSVSNIETFTTVNLTVSKTYTASAILPVTVSHWWTMSFNPAVTWQQTGAIYYQTPIQLNGHYFQIKIIQDFKLPGDFSFQISGFYKSGGLLGINKTSPWGTLDLGLQKKLGKKGTLRIVGSDILNTITHTLTADLPATLNLNAKFYVHPDFPGIKISYSRSFGGANVKAGRDRSIGSEEEQGRVQ